MNILNGYKLVRLSYFTTINANLKLDVYTIVRSSYENARSRRFT